MELRNYETTFIFDNELPLTEIQKTVDGYLALVTKEKGEVLYKSEPTEKKLAYPIRKKASAVYQTVRFKGQPHIIKTLEVLYKRNETIYRFLTVKLTDEELAYQQEKTTKTIESDPNSE